MTTATITTRILDGFDDPSFGRAKWTELLSLGDTHTVNLTWEWQRLWWETFGRGKLLLIVAEREGEAIALAPLFADGGMVFNLCPQDYLDFVGDTSDPSILDALLETARANVQDFAGYLFYFIPSTSRTGLHLQEASARLGLACHDEGSLPCPALNLAEQPQIALAATQKKSLMREESFFRREGPLDILHLRDGADILPHLDEFFGQHISRRSTTPHPSPFLNRVQCDYYRQVTKEIGPKGWLRFTRMNWKGTAIAFHFGLSYRGRYLYGIPSFDINLARHSPGKVLLRQLILAAIAEGATSFDFGIGDEEYKYRFATHVPTLHNWGLYPQ